MFLFLASSYQDLEFFRGFFSMAVRSSLGKMNYACYLESREASCEGKKLRVYNLVEVPWQLAMANVSFK